MCKKRLQHYWRKFIAQKWIYKYINQCLLIRQSKLMQLSQGQDTLLWKTLPKFTMKWVTKCTQRLSQTVAQVWNRQEFLWSVCHLLATSAKEPQHLYSTYFHNCTESEIRTLYILRHGQTVKLSKKVKCRRIRGVVNHPPETLLSKKTVISPQV